jgi:hypothetical protein
MYTEAGKCIEIGLPKSFGVAFHLLVPWMLGMELHNLMFELLCFNLALVCLFLSISQFFPFVMGMFTLYHCVLEVSNIHFYFIQAQRKSLP